MRGLKGSVKGTGPSLRDYLMSDATATSCARPAPAPRDAASAAAAAASVTAAAGGTAGAGATSGATESPAAEDAKSPPLAAVNSHTCCSAWLSIACAIVPDNAERLTFSIDTVSSAPQGSRQNMTSRLSLEALRARRTKDYDYIKQSEPVLPTKQTSNMFTQS